VTATQVSGRQGRIDVTLDGITFTSSGSRATRRSTQRVRQVGWDEVQGAIIELSRKGRPVVRDVVLGEPAGEHHRHDPFSLKVPRHQSQSAQELVAHINAEADARRRWRRNQIDCATEHA
jgi:hypothetical protein